MKVAVIWTWLMSCVENLLSRFKLTCLQLTSRVNVLLKTLKILALVICFVVSCAMYFHLYVVMNKDCIGNTTEEVTYGRLDGCPDTDCQPYSWSCYLH